MNGNSKKFRNVQIAVPVGEAIPLTPGQVLHPDRQAFMDAPNGMQLHQQYDLTTGRYQPQSRLVGQAWADNGQPIVVQGTFTATLPIIYADQGGWQLVYIGA